MSDTPNSLRWLGQLSRRLIQVTPFRSSLAIIDSLISQSALMVGTLLPIKVVMLLGAERIPSYMPPFLSRWSVETLTLVLGGAAVIAFLLYLGAEKLFERLVDSSSRDIVQQARKVVLFENQDQIAINAYKKIITSLAGLVFALGALTLLAFFYGKITLFFLLYMTLCAPLIGRRIQLSRRLRQPPLVAQFLGTLSNLGFLLIFALVLVDHLYFDAPPILVTIIAIILSRQASSKLVGCVKDLVDTSGNRDKISALFFHDHMLLTHTPTEVEGVWSLLQLDQRRHWIEEVLQTAHWLDTDSNIKDIHWLQTGVPNVFAFYVNEDRNGNACIVKIYDSGRHTQAVHEATLLASRMAAQLPAPKLIHSDRYQGYAINVLQLPAGCKAVEDDASFGELAQTFQRQLALCTPTEDITEPYWRSHPMLWQKLDLALFEPLLLAADGEQRARVSAFIEALATCRSQLASLPITLKNPTVNPHTLMVDEDNRPIVWQWGQWALDCFGSFFPANGAGDEQIQTIIEAATEQRPELAQTPAARAQLASATAVLEKCIKGQRYADGLALLPTALQHLQQCTDSEQQ